MAKLLQYNKARFQFEKNIGSSPSNAFVTATQIRTSALLAQGRLDTACKTWDEAHTLLGSHNELAPAAEMLVAKANVLVKEGNQLIARAAELVASERARRLSTQAKDSLHEAGKAEDPEGHKLVAPAAELGPSERASRLMTQGKEYLHDAGKAYAEAVRLCSENKIEHPDAKQWGHLSLLMLKQEAEQHAKDGHWTDACKRAIKAIHAIARSNGDAMECLDLIYEVQQWMVEEMKEAIQHLASKITKAQLLVHAADVQQIKAEQLAKVGASIQLRARTWQNAGESYFLAIEWDFKNPKAHHWQEKAVSAYCRAIELYHGVEVVEAIPQADKTGGLPTVGDRPPARSGWFVARDLMRKGEKELQRFADIQVELFKAKHNGNPPSDELKEHNKNFKQIEANRLRLAYAHMPHLDPKAAAAPANGAASTETTAPANGNGSASAPLTEPLLLNNSNGSAASMAAQPAETAPTA